MVLVFPTSPSVGDQFGSWQWDGNKWTNIAHGAVPEEAPSDGVTYGRVDEDWEPVVRTDGSTPITGNQIINGRVEAGTTVALGQIGLEVARNALVHGDFEVGLNTTVSGNIVGEGTLTVDGWAHLAKESDGLEVGDSSSNPGGYLNVAGVTELSMYSGNTSVGSPGYNASLQVRGATTLATNAGSVTVGDGTTNTTGMLTVVGTTGVCNLTGNMTVGTPANTASLTVRGGATLAERNGNVFIGAAGPPINNATLTVRGATDLATVAGNVTVGGATNSATLTARGPVNLATVTGAVTIGTVGSNHSSLYLVGLADICTNSGGLTIGNATTNNTATLNVRGSVQLNQGTGSTIIGDAANNNTAALSVRGAVNLNQGSGITTIGGAAVATGVGRVAITSNTTGQSSLIVQNITGTSFNQGIRILRATAGNANNWSGIVIGGATGSTQNVDTTGDGTYSMVGGDTVNRVNSRATWWISSNRQGDLTLDQSSPERGPGTTALAATTEPDGSSGIYIRRSDNQVYINGLKVGHQAWKSYRHLLTAVASSRMTAQHTGSVFVSDGVMVRFTIVWATNTGAEMVAGQQIISGIPAWMRPSGDRYFPFTTYQTNQGAPATQRFHTAGDIGVGPATGTNAGTFYVDTAIPAFTSGGYFFTTGFWYVNGRDPPAG